MEYTGNYFHSHAACTFAGQPSTAEGRTLPSEVFSRSCPVLQGFQKQVDTLTQPQVDRLELHICKGYFEGQLVFHWFTLIPETKLQKSKYSRDAGAN